MVAARDSDVRGNWRGLDSGVGAGRSDGYHDSGDDQFLFHGGVDLVFGLGDAGNSRTSGPVSALKRPRRLELLKCNPHPIRKAGRRR